MSAKNNTITEKIAELDALIAWFDSDDFALEEAAARYKEAEKLAATIKKELAGFENEITVLQQTFTESA